MGTAIFEPNCTGCTVVVEAVANPAALASVPAGKAFAGDAFTATITGSGTVKVAFAFSPALAAKGVTIYKLNTLVNPPVWEAVVGVVSANGVISVEGGSGTYALIGNP
jgi:hypothetical protein